MDEGHWAVFLTHLQAFLHIRYVREPASGMKKSPGKVHFSGGFDFHRIFVSVWMLKNAQNLEF